MGLQSITTKSHKFFATLLLLTLPPLYFGSYRYRLVHPYGGQPTLQLNRPASTDFLREWLDTRIISPFNPSAIATYCNRTEWHPNLVFNLENANGGIGNVRGNVLDFIFFAIEAGASIVLPGRAARSQEDISNVWAAHAPFDTFFDEEWFMHTMGQACPEMKIYKPEANQQLADALPGNYLPHTRRIDVDPDATKMAYLEHLDAWLKEKPEYSPENLTLVNLERTLWDIDTRSLPLGFHRNFGQTLRTNPAIARLAAIVVQNLASNYRLLLDPRDAIPKRAFYGAHLRTEADAKNAGWLEEPHSNFSMQTDAYIKQALKHKLKVIYVASGNATDLELFKDKAAAHRPPLNVTSKLDLLPPSEAAAIRDLTWDQQALIDYEVLQRSSVFGGVVKSSFSYNIAMTRNQRIVDSGLVRDPWYVMHQEEGVAFDDGLSRILGRDGWHEMRIPRGMWP
ncbi:hypothetical protein LTR37_006324 [Vermiconidia calcicola]|uniref:Uncharacterized protein n=1 Tax=Vermiconidia calcicola TaxID=1690605 RepID=A0ACC3NIF8_9PEZI|nr:hypothetical protein LTR37_006324 [Vermiconidia calcicola]